MVIIESFMYHELCLTMVKTNIALFMFKVTRLLDIILSKKPGLNKLATDVLLITLD